MGRLQCLDEKEVKYIYCAYFYACRYLLVVIVPAGTYKVPRTLISGGFLLDFIFNAAHSLDVSSERTTEREDYAK